MSVVTISYKARCKHCVNFQRNGRGRPTTCKEGGHPYKGEKTKACDKFKLF